MPAEPADLYTVLIYAIADRDLSLLREALARSTADRRATVDALFAQAVLSGIAPPEFVDFLLAQGADPNSRHDGRPLLTRFFARSADVNLEVLESFLAASPAVNAVDGEGTTALMMAASRSGSGRAEALERLLAAGADPLARDAQGRTAVDWAAGVPAPDYVEVFRAHGMGRDSATPPGAIPAPQVLRELPPGLFFVLSPVGTPLSLRWVCAEESLDAAVKQVQERLAWSRSPIGPFPVLQLVSATDRSRLANALAVRQLGKAAPGALLVLSLVAVSQVPLFVVSGVFPAAAVQAAQSMADAQPGWSMVARLETLTRMEDGCPSPVEELQIG
jgi:ankyrin repeat protein